MENVFTFWEGPMPAYIRLCMKTWKFPFTVLNYKNIYSYTEFDVESAKRFTLPQIADCVRAHVLRDNGGYWLDADTIMLSDKLPKDHMIGNPHSRTNTIGFLHTEKDSEMYKLWTKHQDRVIADPNSTRNWDVMGNAFTDLYVREHEDITIAPVAMCWPETYMIQGVLPRNKKYQKFYFEQHKHLKDLLPTNMLMLHNSWTPDWYKGMTEEDILTNIACASTMSNILREVLCDTL
jgi:hypothetical protein